MYSGSWQKKNFQKRETLRGGRHNAYPVLVVVVVVVVVYRFFLLVCVLVRMDARGNCFSLHKGREAQILLLFAQGAPAHSAAISARLYLI